MNQSKSWLLKIYQIDKTTVSLIEKKERSNIREKSWRKQRCKRGEKSHQRILHTPSSRYCGVLPRDPLQDQKTHSAFLASVGTDGPQLAHSHALSFSPTPSPIPQELLLAKGAVLPTIPFSVYGPIGIGDSSHLETRWLRNIIFPASCLALGQL